MDTFEGRSRAARRPRTRQATLPGRTRACPCISTCSIPPPSPRHPHPAAWARCSRTCTPPRRPQRRLRRMSCEQLIEPALAAHLRRPLLAHTLLAAAPAKAAALLVAAVAIGHRHRVSEHAREKWLGVVAQKGVSEHAREKCLGVVAQEPFCWWCDFRVSGRLNRRVV